MAHTGVEPKPTWRSIPLAVRGAAEAVVGAEVRRAQRVWGGYGPTPTYRLRLTDGRAAFFKAVGPASPDGVRGALAAEERIYRELSNLISPWAPAFRGAVQRDGWHALLLEDSGPEECAALDTGPDAAGHVGLCRLSPGHVGTAHTRMGPAGRAGFSYRAASGRGPQTPRALAPWQRSLATPRRSPGTGWSPPLPR